MLLHKIGASPFFRQFKTHYIWVAFILLIFILTNAFSSLSLIHSYRLGLADMLMTYGFIIFVGLMEGLLFSLALTAIYFLLRPLFKTMADRLMRRVLICGLLIAWSNLFLTIFLRPLF